MCIYIAAPGYEWLTDQNYTEDAHKHKSCHHELKQDEIWLGNTSGDERWEKGVEIPTRYKSLKTIRLGEQAYCVHGLPISRSYCKPLIIHKSEEKEFERLYNKR